MSVAAAIRITSRDEEHVIAHAAAFAQKQNAPCYVISIVPSLPYGATSDDERAIVQRNLASIAAHGANPVMQEGDDVPQMLIHTARTFGIATLFVQSGHPRRLGRSIAEQLLYLAPPFDVVVVGNAGLWPPVRSAS
jgi:K+-sensing histidine kinase KdpD